MSNAAHGDGDHPACRSAILGAMRSGGTDIRIREAAERLAGVVEETPILPFDVGDVRVRLLLKLENRQVTGSFKVRGAWNQISLLSAEQRARGVIATSSGNHGKALAWAAQRAGVAATIVMPADAYANKIAACRELGAEVVLGESREEAEAVCAERVAGGCVLVHPYDAERTVQGAGTVGLEITQQDPDVEVVVVPVGGGGLITGVSLAVRQELGDAVAVIGAEPEGAASLTRGLAAREPVLLDEITTEVQGLCPLASGAINIATCAETVDEVLLLRDEEIFAAQAALVGAGEIVEPAGAATTAVLLGRHLPERLYIGRSAEDPLRVVAIVSGGNPDPAQLEAVRARG
jgi:threonine dehydratase